LGLPRGGVPVGYEIARAMGTPLDVLVVRPIAVPAGFCRGPSPAGEPDGSSRGRTLGAIAAGGVRVLDWSAIAARDVPRSLIEDAARGEAVEVARKERFYRGRHQGPKMTGSSVVLVDDGLGAAATMRAAVQALRAYPPASITLVLPAAPAE